jgi:hypothetical protein
VSVKLFHTATKEPAMAASLTVEEERGTFVRSPHPHNGYYAGDFSRSYAPSFVRHTHPDGEPS